MKNSKLLLLTLLFIISAVMLSSCMGLIDNAETGDSSTEAPTGSQAPENTDNATSAPSDEAVPPQVPSDLNVYTKNANAGDTVEIPVVLSNNPGMVSMQLHLQYDATIMTLEEVRDGGIMGENDSSAVLTKVPYILSWANDTAKSNITTTGTLVTLVFKINADAVSGTYPVEISYDKNNYDIINVDMNSVDIGIANGAVIIK